MVVPRGNGDKGNSAVTPRPGGSATRDRQPVPVTTNCVQDEIARLRAARVEMQRLCLSAQHQLERAKQIRAAAERYQEETEVRARSQAQQLILQARLATQKEIAELKRKTSGGIKELLASFNVIRSASLAVLEAQRKFVDAARIKSLSSGLQESDVEESEGEPCGRIVDDAASLLEKEPLEGDGAPASENATPEEHLSGLEKGICEMAQSVLSAGEPSGDMPFEETK